MDFAAISTALAKSNLLDKVAGEKGASVKELLSSGNKADALKGLLEKKNSAETVPEANSASAPATSTQAAETPKSAEDQVKEKATKKLKKITKLLILKIKTITNTLEKLGLN